MRIGVNHVVGFSGGVTSWYTARMVVDDIAAPADRVVLLFADTLIEDDSTMRFLHAAAVDLGLPVTRTADGRTPWQVFEDQRMLGNDRIAVCSRVLKRELIDRWCRENCDPAASIRYVGMDWSEINRWERHRDALAAVGWTARAPMVERGVGKQDAMRAAVARLVRADAERGGRRRWGWLPGGGDDVAYRLQH